MRASIEEFRTTAVTNKISIGTAIQLVGYCSFWFIASLIVRSASRDIFLQKGLFNFDLLATGCIALFLPRIWAPILLICSMLLDIAAGFFSTYFFRPQDIFYAIRSMGLLPAHRLEIYACLTLVVFGALGTTSYVLRTAVARHMRIQIALLLFLVTIAMLLIDTWNGHRIFNHPDTIPEYRLVRVSELSIIKQWLNAYKIAHGNFMGRTDDQYSDSASERGLALLQAAKQQKINIVEILVEAWGGDNNTALADRLVAGYKSPEITQQYQVLSGMVPFWGPTVSGEIRELCHSRLGFGILRPEGASLLGKCLPAELKQQGYQTVAIHGYFGGMFDRSQWYPLIGFDSRWFWRNLHDQGLSNCSGAFPGICDHQIARWLSSRLSNTKAPTFFYWVTLNSHLPLPASVSGLNPISCSFDPQANTHESLCAWFKLEYEVHQSIADLASTPGIQPTAFIIVGDHAPPFADPNIRGRFSSASVPFVLLIPKTIQRN